MRTDTPRSASTTQPLGTDLMNRSSLPTLRVLAGAFSLTVSLTFALLGLGPSARAATGTAERASDNASDSANDFSPAERALFMSNQIGSLHPPMALRYAFHKSGSLEPAFDDRVVVQLRAEADGSCCAASGEFLSGERRIQLPDVDDAKGNPVILFFLEREVREMHRLTTGPENYFRKRIRMAIYNGASVRDVSLRYRGAAVPGREIVITPYSDDPNRPRFEKFADKQYTFTLSDAVPGGVVAIRSQVADKTSAAMPLAVEELIVDGAEGR
jgi:hypothetical protein